MFFLKFVSKNFLLLLLTLFLLLNVFTKYKNYGVTFDEFDQIDLGKQAINYYFEGTDKSLLNLHFAPFFFTTRGVFPEFFIQLGRKVLGGESLDSYHMLLGVLNSSSYIFVFLSVLVLTKSKTFSLMAVLGLYYFPRFSGDIFNNSKDTPVGVVLSVFIYFTIKYFLSTKNTNKLLIIVALTLGVLVSTRVVTLYLFPILLVLVFVKNRLNTRRFIGKLSLTIVYFLISLHIFSPYLHLYPIFGLFRMIKDSISYPDIGLTFFEGSKIMSDQIPKHYLIKYILISTPEYLMGIFLVVNIFILLSYIYKRWLYGERKIFHLMVFLDFIVVIPIIISVLFNPNLYDGWRHFIFLTIPLVTLCFTGLFFLCINFKSFSKIIILTTVVFFIPIIYESNYLYPYEYVYFNNIVGSFRDAAENYETDYWGKSFRESALWINENYNSLEGLPVFSCVGHLSKPYLNSEVKFMDTKPDVPFIYTCFTRLGGNTKYGGDVLFTVERHGVALNEVRLIR